jgi:hypothetical protein
MTGATPTNEEAFIPVGVEICPKCEGENLSWCVQCFWCGHDFIDPEEPPQQTISEKAGAA